MSIPKKGSRSVVVDGTEYLWRIRKRPTYSQAIQQGGMTMAVQSLQDGARRILVVDFGVARPDNWFFAHSVSITPRIVRRTIEASQAAGWNPMEQGGPFQFRFDLVAIDE